MEEKLKELDKRVERLEETIKNFMDKWGPDVQEKRAKRDKVWDEMVRVVSLQEKHKDWNYPKYDGDGKPLGRNDD